MFSAWSFEDFRLPPAGFGGAQDHWEPIREISLDKISTDTKTGQSFGDFWDPLPNSAQVDSTNSNVNAWSDDLELPLFEAGAAENPFLLRLHAPLSDSLVIRRARWLLSLLDVPAPLDRKRLLAHFVEIFDHYTNASTFRALTDLALDDSSGEEIAAAFQLRMIWSECPKLWIVRVPKLSAPIVPHNGRSALTWTRAIRLVRLSRGLPPECIIDDDWYEEWLELPFGDPAFWSFLDYATLRREAFSAGALDLPQELRRRNGRALPSPGSGGNAIDGFPLGSTSRTGQLIRLTTDAWALSCFVRSGAKSNSQQS
jgi:hypothetical protein